MRPANAVALVLALCLLAACGRNDNVAPTAVEARSEPVSSTPATPVATTSPALTPSTVASAPTPLAIPDPIELPDPTAAVIPPTGVPELGVTATEDPTATVDGAPAEPPVAASPAPTTVPPATPAVSDDSVSQEARVANGGEVYTLNCARCHGENGLGTAQYSGLFGVGDRYSTAGMIAELTNGHPVTFGFADRLSADEIASVVAYVKAAFP